MYQLDEESERCVCPYYGKETVLGKGKVSYYYIKRCWSVLTMFAVA